MASLRHLLALLGRPAMLAVDNASSDGTMQALAESGPLAEAIEAGANQGAAGRNIGVMQAGTSRHARAGFAEALRGARRGSAIARRLPAGSNARSGAPSGGAGAQEPRRPLLL